MITIALALALAPPVLPDDSLYLLDARFEDHAGEQVSLDLYAGQPVVLAMFYASCPSACPRLIADVKRALGTLDEQERKEVRVVIVSLDPARDTPELLAGVLRTHALDPERTTLMRANADDTRKLAALLGVKYRDDGTGAIDHSSRIVVLDRDGRIAGKRDGLGGSVDDVAKQVRAVLRTSAPKKRA